MRKIRRLFWGLLLFFDALLVVLFLAGYAARYVPPETVWWFQLVAIALPYLSLLVLVAAAVAVLMRRKVGFTVHAVLVVLIVIRFVPYEHFSVSGSEEAEALTVMTFNAPVGWTYLGAERAVEMAYIVRAESPDVIGFQEAYISYHKKAPRVRPESYLVPLLDSLGFNTLSPPTGRKEAKYPAVLSRKPIETFEVSHFEVDPGPWFTPRIVRAQLSFQGHAYVLYNIHLKTYGDKKIWREENKNLTQIKLWLSYLMQYKDAILKRAEEARIVRAKVAQETLPVILLGDFNSTAHNWVYAQLADGLQDVYRTAGRGWGSTYHTLYPVVRIDFMLVSPIWQIREAYVVPSLVSDHRPLVARMQWPD